MLARGMFRTTRLSLTASLLMSTASGASVVRPASLKLYYGDMPFWRAEVVRLALHIGEVAFEDVRDQSRVDLIAAGKLTFGAVPVLEADGRILSQTQAMAVYAAKLANLHPEDAWEAAKVDECINGCTDVTSTIGMTFRLSDDEKMAARAPLASRARCSKQREQRRRTRRRGRKGTHPAHDGTTRVLTIWTSVNLASSDSQSSRCAA